MTARLGGGLDPFVNTTHYRVRGAAHSLCDLPVMSDWERPRPNPIIPASVNCSQCHTNRAAWITDARILETIIEPFPAAKQRHVTTDDDPGRGRHARPPRLQLCLVCFRFRGVGRSFDNLCACDVAAWDRGPAPRAGDLSSDAWLCKSCLLSVVGGASRWSLYHCHDCKPAVVLLNRLALRCVIPIGPHSIMNGVFWKAPEGLPMTDAQAVAFNDQLTTLFKRQDSLDDYNRDRLRQRVSALGFDGHAVPVDDFRIACTKAGYTKPAAFSELVRSLSEDVDSDFIWHTAHSNP
jgi:hypothetical protein